MDIHDLLIGDDKITIRVLYIDKVRHIIDQGIKQMLFIKQLLCTYFLLLRQKMCFNRYPCLTEFFQFGFQTLVNISSKGKKSPGNQKVSPGTKLDLMVYSRLQIHPFHFRCNQVKEDPGDNIGGTGNNKQGGISDFNIPLAFPEFQVYSLQRWQPACPRLIRRIPLSL